jgi:hypothetical protein
MVENRDVLGYIRLGIKEMKDVAVERRFFELLKQLQIFTLVDSNS